MKDEQEPPQNPSNRPRKADKHEEKKEKKMREHYDFSKMNGRKNPYVKYLKQSVTVNLDRDTVDYFKSMAEEAGIPTEDSSGE